VVVDAQATSILGPLVLGSTQGGPPPPRKLQSTVYAALVLNSDKHEKHEAPSSLASMHMAWLRTLV
jgi:hypothetical protein